jgi:arginine/lysine/ornithine decarboxylase
MPGHKRNPKYALEPALWQDVTEIEGLDDLHNASGVIESVQTLAARVYGVPRSFLLVNGSTCGNLAAIRALAERYGGTELAVVGDAHRSVAHAAELCNLTLTTPERATDARVCVATSPSYEGVTLDVVAISAECERRGLALHVDSAHGAHLGFNEYFPPNAATLGAVTVVESLHKTLPALGQTSVLHLCSDALEPRRLQRQLDVFQTSSPSYVLLASAEHCLRLLERDGVRLFADFAERLRRFYASVERVASVRQPSRGLDPSKILLRGGSAPDLLRRNGFEPERVTLDGTLLLTSFCDEDEIFQKLSTLLLKGA